MKKLLWHKIDATDDDPGKDWHQVQLHDTDAVHALSVDPDHWSVERPADPEPEPASKTDGEPE